MASKFNGTMYVYFSLSGAIGYQVAYEESGNLVIFTSFFFSFSSNNPKKNIEN